MSDQNNEGCSVMDPCQHSKDTRDMFDKYVVKMNGSLDRLWEAIRDGNEKNQAAFGDARKELKAEIQTALAPILAELSEARKKLPLWATALAVVYAAATTGIIGFLVARVWH